METNRILLKLSGEALAGDKHRESESQSCTWVCRKGAIRRTGCVCISGYPQSGKEWRTGDRSHCGYYAYYL